MLNQKHNLSLTPFYISISVLLPFSLSLHCNHFFFFIFQIQVAIDYRMDAKAARRLQLSAVVQPQKIGRRLTCSLGMSREPQRVRVFVSAKLSSTIRRRTTKLEVACSYDNIPASILESGTHHAPLDEELILKNKSQEIKSYLNGRCIFLVGMMGSGKPTVGKIMSQVLDYAFFDNDTLVEEVVGWRSVAYIFKRNGEDLFRDEETRALYNYSQMRRLVISTGVDAVTRPINWKYMHKGVIVWLDVPVEALAPRIAAVGTNSRPLLRYEAGDAYTRALMRFSAIFEERSEAYANAHARVSLENIAIKLSQSDVSELSPIAIAIEALEQIHNFLNGEGSCYSEC
ncbi:shikimate kinase, chloroplastic-like [Abrus precatorius]|uniref:Shikimate kinase, chloroplastic-like n=1 Tax=Abrus precatorius TaxID=3816 RepID=A0A8B8MJ03_ABRPR|nr:shikimate kinase, chloroplastic-like [Abrus precatorius]